MLYSISYDLQNATSEYQDLYDGIKAEYRSSYKISKRFVRQNVEYDI